MESFIVKQKEFSGDSFQDTRQPAHLNFNQNQQLVQQQNVMANQQEQAKQNFQMNQPNNPLSNQNVGMNGGNANFPGMEMNQMQNQNMGGGPLNNFGNSQHHQQMLNQNLNQQFNQQPPQMPKQGPTQQQNLLPQQQLQQHHQFQSNQGNPGMNNMNPLPMMNQFNQQPMNQIPNQNMMLNANMNMGGAGFGMNGVQPGQNNQLPQHQMGMIGMMPNNNIGGMGQPPNINQQQEQQLFQILQQFQYQQQQQAQGLHQSPNLAQEFPAPRPEPKQNLVELSCCNKTTDADTYTKVMNRFYKGEDKLFSVNKVPIIPKCAFCQEEHKLEDLEILYPDKREELELHFQHYKNWQKKIQEVQDEMKLLKDVERLKEKPLQVRNSIAYISNPAYSNDDLRNPPQLQSQKSTEIKKGSKAFERMRNPNLTVQCCNCSYLLQLGGKELDRETMKMQILVECDEVLFKYSTPKCPLCEADMTIEQLLELFPEEVELITKKMAKK